MKIVIKEFKQKIPWLMLLLFVLIAVEGLGLLVEKVKADTFSTSVEVGNSAPTVGTVSFYYDPTNLTIPEWAAGAGTYNVSTTFTVTDLNGWAEIATTTIYVYRSGVAGVPGCTSDINNCYPSTSSDSGWNPGVAGVGDNGAICARTATTSNTADFWCTTTFYYVAEATDAATAGYDYNTENWVAYASTSDINWAQGNAQDTIEITSNPALDRSPGTVTYPNLSANANSTNDWRTTTVTTTGNVGIDIHLSGGNMTGSGDPIVPAQQKFTTTTPAVYGTGDYALTSGGETHDLAMSKSTNTDPISGNSDEVYWGIAIPAAQAAGTYTGTDTLTATSTYVYP